MPAADGEGVRRQAARMRRYRRQLDKGPSLYAREELGNSTAVLSKSFKPDACDSTQGSRARAGADESPFSGWGLSPRDDPGSAAGSPFSGWGSPIGEASKAASQRGAVCTAPTVPGTPHPRGRGSTAVADGAITPPNPRGEFPRPSPPSIECAVARGSRAHALPAVGVGVAADVEGTPLFVVHAPATPTPSREVQRRACRSHQGMPARTHARVAYDEFAWAQEGGNIAAGGVRGDIPEGISVDPESPTVSTTSSQLPQRGGSRVHSVRDDEAWPFCNGGGAKSGGYRSAAGLFLAGGDATARDRQHRRSRNDATAAAAARPQVAVDAPSASAFVTLSDSQITGLHGGATGGGAAAPRSPAAAVAARRHRPAAMQPTPHTRHQADTRRVSPPRPHVPAPQYHAHPAVMPPTTPEPAVGHAPLLVAALPLIPPLPGAGAVCARCHGVWLDGRGCTVCGAAAARPPPSPSPPPSVVRNSKTPLRSPLAPRDVNVTCVHGADVGAVKARPSPRTPAPADAHTSAWEYFDIPCTARVVRCDRSATPPRPYPTRPTSAAVTASVLAGCGSVASRSTTASPADFIDDAPLGTRPRHSQPRPGPRAESPSLPPTLDGDRMLPVTLAGRDSLPPPPLSRCVQHLSHASAYGGAVQGRPLTGGHAVRPSGMDYPYPRPHHHHHHRENHQPDVNFAAEASPLSAFSDGLPVDAATLHVLSPGGGAFTAWQPRGYGAHRPPPLAVHPSRISPSRVGAVEVGDARIAPHIHHRLHGHLPGTTPAVEPFGVPSGAAAATAAAPHLAPSAGAGGHLLEGGNTRRPPLISPEKHRPRGGPAMHPPLIPPSAAAAVCAAPQRLPSGMPHAGGQDGQPQPVIYPHDAPPHPPAPRPSRGVSPERRPAGPEAAGGAAQRVVAMHAASDTTVAGDHAEGQRPALHVHFGGGGGGQFEQQQQQYPPTVDPNPPHESVDAFDAPPPLGPPFGGGEADGGRLSADPPASSRPDDPLSAPLAMLSTAPPAEGGGVGVEGGLPQPQPQPQLPQAPHPEEETLSAAGPTTPPRPSTPECAGVGVATTYGDGSVRGLPQQAAEPNPPLSQIRPPGVAEGSTAGPPVRGVDRTGSAVHVRGAGTDTAPPSQAEVANTLSLSWGRPHPPAPPVSPAGACASSDAHTTGAPTDDSSTQLHVRPWAHPPHGADPSANAAASEPSALPSAVLPALGAGGSDATQGSRSMTPHDAPMLPPPRTGAPTPFDTASTSWRFVKSEQVPSVTSAPRSTRALPEPKTPRSKHAVPPSAAAAASASTHTTPRRPQAVQSIAGSGVLPRGGAHAVMGRGGGAAGRTAHVSPPRGAGPSGAHGIPRAGGDWRYPEISGSGGGGGGARVTRRGASHTAHAMAAGAVGRAHAAGPAPPAHTAVHSRNSSPAALGGGVGGPRGRSASWDSAMDAAVMQRCGTAPGRPAAGSPTDALSVSATSASASRSPQRSAIPARFAAEEFAPQLPPSHHLEQQQQQQQQQQQEQRAPSYHSAIHPANPAPPDQSIWIARDPPPAHSSRPSAAYPAVSVTLPSSTRDVNGVPPAFAAAASSEAHASTGRPAMWQPVAHAPWQAGL